MSSLPPNKPNIPLYYLAMHAVCMKCVYNTSTYTLMNFAMLSRHVIKLVYDTTTDTPLLYG
jgi:hypothetical protein